MKTISILNLKGGVGKTTTALHLAEFLSAHKKRTLLIDLDGQCNLTQFYGIEVSKTENVYRLFDDKEAVQPKMIHRRLSILPSNVKTSKIDINIASEPDMIYILRNILNNTRYKAIYDYVVIDCPPSIGLSVLNALTASTYPHTAAGRRICLRRAQSLVECRSKHPQRLQPRPADAGHPSDDVLPADESEP